jgi:hypothetical protein
MTFLGLFVNAMPTHGPSLGRFVGEHWRHLIRLLHTVCAVHTSAVCILSARHNLLHPKATHNRGLFTVTPIYAVLFLRLTRVPLCWQSVTMLCRIQDCRLLRILSDIVPWLDAWALSPTCKSIVHSPQSTVHSCLADRSDMLLAP